ncbi:GNAT family N-acetyltransferase [Rhodanobacter sp. Col0626]|uniref:GNAT family N-acetyltransferase n=1 Tax=Rhodanobacter sp. Col0626 TaxID=3415679 RepID=UPI003CE7C94E
MTAVLHGFPVARVDYPRAPPALLDRGVALRPAGEADLAWLRALYAETRAEELAIVPWDPQVKQAFLDSQFDLQHRHYLTHFGQADYLVIEEHTRPIGRLYLLREPPAFRVIDIALSASARCHGTGSALISDIQKQAAALGYGVVLQVDSRNHNARRLYERLGFLATEPGDSHVPMSWGASTLS